jgi:hypothetical protein
MLILRILGVLVIATLGVSILAYLFSRDKRYLRFAFQVFKYSLFFAVAILSLFMLERIIPGIL